MGRHQPPRHQPIQIDPITLAIARRRFMPYGEPRGTQPTGWLGTKGYVDGTNDDTGLTHLGAREYDPTLGRFISVDPIMDLADPQQWHPYTYTDNNPITFSDPSGLYAFEDVYGGGQKAYGGGGGGAKTAKVTGKSSSSAVGEVTLRIRADGSAHDRSDDRTPPLWQRGRVLRAVGRPELFRTATGSGSPVLLQQSRRMPRRAGSRDRPSTASSSSCCSSVLDFSPVLAKSWI